jgi:hypothetical protein
MSRGEPVCPFVGELPGGGVLVNRLRHGAAVSVERFPRSVDDEWGTVVSVLALIVTTPCSGPPGLIDTNGPDALVIHGSSGRLGIAGVNRRGRLT